MIGEARVVVQARRLERAHRDLAVPQVRRVPTPCGWKTVAVTAARRRPRAAGVKRAQVHRLAEPEAARAKNAVAKAPSQHRLLRRRAEISRIDADRQHDLERDVVRALELHILAGEPVAFDVRSRLFRSGLTGSPPPRGSAVTKAVYQLPVQRKRRAASSICAALLGDRVA